MAAAATAASGVGAATAAAGRVQAGAYWQEGTGVAELTEESIAEMEKKKRQQRNCPREYHDYFETKTKFFTKDCPGWPIRLILGPTAGSCKPSSRFAPVWILLSN